MLRVGIPSKWISMTNSKYRLHFIIVENCQINPSLINSDLIWNAEMELIEKKL